MARASSPLLLQRSLSKADASLPTGGNVVCVAQDLVEPDMADLTGFHDWTEYLHIIDEKLATIVDRILAGDVATAN